MVGGHLGSVGGAAWEQLKTRHNTLKEWNERFPLFLFLFSFFTIKENDVLKWEKVHQTLSGLLNRHRFSLIRVNFPAPFSEEQKNKTKCVVSVFLSTFDYPRAASCVCVLCPWVGMKFGTAEMRN